MAVSSARFASQIVAPGEEPRFFDDLGCLAAYLREHPARRLARWPTSPTTARPNGCRPPTPSSPGSLAWRRRWARMSSRTPPRHPATAIPPPRAERRSTPRPSSPGRLPDGVAMTAVSRPRTPCALRPPGTRPGVPLSLDADVCRRLRGALALAVAVSGYILSGGSGVQDFARTAASLVQLVDPARSADGAPAGRAGARLRPRQRRTALLAARAARGHSHRPRAGPVPGAGLRAGASGSAPPAS